jgi:hypothetical protein
MAIEHIRSLISSTQKTCKLTNLSFPRITFPIILAEPLIIDKRTHSKLAAYCTGYHNGTCDAYEYVEKNSDDNRFHIDLIRYIKEKEIQLKNLTG